MRRLLAVLFAVWLLPVGAAAEARDPSLERKLLQLEDMPDGWAESVDEDEDDDEPICGIKLPAAAGRATAGYSAGGPLGAFAYSKVLRYSSATVARKYLDQLAAALKRCPAEIETTDSGKRETTRYTTLKLPKLGDQTVGVRFSLTGGDLSPIQGDVVMIRRGAVIGAVSSLGVMAPAPDTIKLARKQAARLR